MSTSDSDATSSSSYSNIKIYGSLRHALIIDTLTFFTSFAASVAISPIVNSMPLSDPLKNILVAAAPISGAILQLPVAISMDKNGGKKAIIWVRITSLFGVFGLTVLAASTDLTNLDRFDFRYGIMFFCNLLAGASIGTFPLITNALYWARIKDAGHVQALYAGIGGSSLGLSLLFLQFTLEKIGLAATLGIFSSILLVGTLLAAKFIIEPPYHQLINKDLSTRKALELAKRAGQEKFPIRPIEGYLKDVVKLLKDYRTIALCLAVLVSFGGFLSSSLSMFLALTNILNISTRNAVVITAVGSLWSTMIRVFTGKPMDTYDKSGGVFTFFFSSILMLIGSLMLGFSRPTPSLSYALVAKFFMDTGFGIGSAATFKKVVTWSNPSNTNYPNYNIGSMSGVVSTAGASSGFIFPSVVALLVFLSGTNGYLDNFLITAVMSVIAGSASLLTHYKLNHSSCFWRSQEADSEITTSESTRTDSDFSISISA